MKVNNKIKIFILTGFLLCGAFALDTKAQSPSPTPDATLIACEQTADALKRTTIERDSLKAQLDIANQRIALRDEQIANKEEQLQFWKTAAQTGDKMDTNSQLIVLNLRTQVADDQVRIKDLEEENKSLRRSRDWRTAIGFVGGFATGYFTHK